MINFTTKTDMVEYMNLNNRDKELFLNNLDNKIANEGIDFNEVPINPFDIIVGSDVFTLGVTYRGFSEENGIELNYWVFNKLNNSIC